MNAKNNITVAALIVAGGKGQRIGGELPKQYHKIGGKTILEKSIKAFYNNKLVDKVCVVIAKDHEALFKNFADKYKNLIFCYGGNTRQDSVRLGLKKLAEFSPEKILIHDAARPFVSESIIYNVINELKNSDAVLPAVKVKDTIKVATGMAVKETLPRENLFSAQTPQGFKFDIIHNLHKKYSGMEFTDDVALAEKDGIKVKIVEGEYSNYKITTEDDLKMASQKNIRVGNGFDVHQFEDGDGVILCGIKIPYSKKLKGHSDADCTWHALTDAILGAIGLGDIGEHFPDSDSKWKNADSAIFLKHSVDEVKKLGGVINNVDITIICEEPKMKLHKEKMKENTAKVLGIEKNQINIKATTTENLGFLGRKEGLAVLATATISI
jgi:2-C-methyl-D-erythritol 4-phosphate cytidylyltransferase / 2-C-methyl-D-erythritol 2,4-cyclodiphosphate synthase